MASKADEINRIYNEKLNSKPHLVDCMELVRKWEREGFASYKDAVNFYLDHPDSYFEVCGQRHQIKSLRSLVCLLRFFCDLEGVPDVTLEDCDRFIQRTKAISLC
jgi:hypothetical protein